MKWDSLRQNVVAWCWMTVLTLLSLRLTLMSLLRLESATIAVNIYIRFFQWHLLQRCLGWRTWFLQSWLRLTVFLAELKLIWLFTLFLGPIVQRLQWCDLSLQIVRVSLLKVTSFCRVYFFGVLLLGIGLVVLTAHNTRIVSLKFLNHLRIVVFGSLAISEMINRLCVSLWLLFTLFQVFIEDMFTFQNLLGCAQAMVVYRHQICICTRSRLSSMLIVYRRFVMECLGKVVFLSWAGVWDQVLTTNYCILWCYRLPIVDCCIRIKIMDAQSLLS